MRSSNYIRDQINEKLDIKSEFEKYGIDYKEVSPNEYRILCPFHEEKTPSCFVNSEIKKFHCFGCQESGDLVKIFAKIADRPIFEYLENKSKDLKIEFPKDLRDIISQKRDSEIKKELWKLRRKYDDYCFLYRKLLKLSIKQPGISDTHVLLYQVENMLDYLEYRIRELKKVF